MIHSLGLFGLFFFFNLRQAKKYFQPTFYDTSITHPVKVSRLQKIDLLGKREAFSWKR